MPSATLTFNQYAAWIDIEERLPFSSNTLLGPDPTNVIESGMSIQSVLDYHGIPYDVVEDIVESASLNINASTFGNEDYDGSNTFAFAIKVGDDLLYSVIGELNVENGNHEASIDVNSIALPSISGPIAIEPFRDNEGSFYAIELIEFSITVNYSLPSSEFWTDFIGAEELT